MKVKIIEQGYKSLNMFQDEINSFLSQDDLIVVHIKILESTNLKAVIIYKKGNM